VTRSRPLRGRQAEAAFLDANVIRGQLTTDVLLTLAERKIIEPYWSQTVLDEMRRNWPAGVAEERIDRRIAIMNRYFPDAMISGHEPPIPEMPADAKDQHVLAAAVHSRCAVLVTDNTKDFYPPSSGPYAMRVESMAQFLDRKNSAETCSGCHGHADHGRPEQAESARTSVHRWRDHMRCGWRS
jgi:predicted nucleic acid-binding protein